MTDLKACFSSKTDDWATPQDFYDKLDAEFHFTLDQCADEYNHKCDLFYTKEQNGLAQDWGAFCLLSTLWIKDDATAAERRMIKWGVEQNDCGNLQSLSLAPIRVQREAHRSWAIRPVHVPAVLRAVGAIYRRAGASDAG